MPRRNPTYTPHVGLRCANPTYQLVRRPELENPTIVVITDRNDLDDQLFGTFAMCADLLRQTPIQVQSREELRQALNRASGGIIFTTLQKFSPARGP